VNYKDEEKELDKQIQAELRRRRGGNIQQSPSSSSPKELQALLKNSPVRKVVRNLPLSSYLRQIRTSLGANTRDFAVALNLPIPTIEELESKKTLPWTVSAPVVAQVAESLRLHIVAVERLATHSHTIAMVSRQLDDQELAKQLMQTWLEEVKVELQNRGANNLLR
jgi:transcriptional regulator with XRE-family HTH domain